MKIRIEDDFQDVLMKAATGLGLGKRELAERAKLAEEDVAALLGGKPDAAALRAVAPALELDPDSLLVMAEGQWYPGPVQVEGLRQYNTPHPVPGYQEMTVNSYLVWNKADHHAMVFDTGANLNRVLNDIGLLNLSLKALFITHTHHDHIAAYDELLQAHPGLPTYAPDREPHAKAMPVAHGDRFHIADLSVEAHLTDGHSPGGTTYVISGLETPVAIVGDAIFCLSVGGVPENAYQDALGKIRNHILGQPDDTVLCPGHGPMTTVADEKAHNPFFPEFK